MKLSKKTIIISSIVVVLIAILIAAVAIIKINVNKPRNLLKALPDVDLKIKGFVYTEVGEANVKWEVTAETATYSKKQNLAVFDRVQIKLTTSDGKVFIMKGDKGLMFTDTKNIEIKDNVVIISDAGDRFSTDHLSYNDAEKKFYTDAPVTMENKRMKITGVGLTLFMNTGELNLSSLVKAKIN
jgi:LPS export ABC transporter protein LptC